MRRDLIEGELECPYCAAQIEFDFSELNEDVSELEKVEDKKIADEKIEDDKPEEE